MDSVKTETLAEYVKRVRDKNGWSVEKVAEQSRGKISQAYVNKIENNGVKNVSPEKLKALAKGLGVPEHELLTVAGFKNVISPQSDPVLTQIYGHFSGYENLDEKDKQELEPMLVMIANDIKRRLAEKLHKEKK